MVKGKPVCEHAPKRPLSGYFLFAADVRPKVTGKHPKWSVKEVMSEIAKQWNDLGEAKKAPFQNKAKKEQDAYQKKLEKYKKTSHYAKHQEALAAWKKEQSVKPFKKDPNRPKKGLSAYLIFVNEKRPALTKQGFEMLEVSKEASKMWAALSDAQKAPYEKKAAKSKADAQKAMDKYMKSKQYKEYMAEKEAWEAKRKAAKKSGSEGRSASAPKK